jgi:hypothetical protein
MFSQTWEIFRFSDFYFFASSRQLTQCSNWKTLPRLCQDYAKINEKSRNYHGNTSIVAWTDGKAKARKEFRTTLTTTIETLQSIANTTLDDECTMALNAFNESWLEESPLTRKRKRDKQEKHNRDVQQEKKKQKEKEDNDSEKEQSTEWLPKQNKWPLHFITHTYILNTNRNIDLTLIKMFILWSTFCPPPQKKCRSDWSINSDPHFANVNLLSMY